jgi:F-box and WD-40 domain protein CDC4
MSAPTIYVPIASPPTPAPSPRPFSDNSNGINSLLNYDPAALSRREFASLASSPPAVRRRYLLSMLGECTPSELLFISTTITPLLKRDFLRELPPEIALHILSFIDDPRALARASQVSRKWRSLVSDECLWKEMCESFQFDLNNLPSPTLGPHADNPLPDTPEQLSVSPIDPALQWLASQRQNSPRQLKQKHVATESQSRPSHLEDPTHDPFSYRRHFKYSYGTSQCP